MNTQSPPKLLVVVGRTWRWLERNSAWLALLLAAITILAAFAGLAWEAGDTRQFENWLTGSMYETGQVVSLNMDPHEKDYNPAIGIARVGSVLLAALVAIAAIGRLFRESVQRLRLAVRGKRNIMVCGLGSIGCELVNEFTSKGDFVVVHDLAIDTYAGKRAEEGGAVVVQSDITDEESLRGYVTSEPRAAYFVTGNDQSNLAALANICSLRAAYQQSKGIKLQTVECYVHITDPKLHHAVSHTLYESAVVARETGVSIRPFNIFHQTAAQLIIDKLTTVRPRGRDQVALYVIFGFGRMGQAMLRELTELAHFENQKRSRIVVLSPDAATACRSCLAKTGQLSPRFVRDTLVDFEFDPRCDEWTSRNERLAGNYAVDDENAVEYAANVHFIDADESAVSQADVGELVRLATEQDVCPAVLFCYDEDETNFRLATELNAYLKSHHGVNQDLQSILPEERERYQRGEEFHLPIYCYLPHSPALRKLLNDRDEKYPVVPFGDVAEGLARVHDRSVEQIAMEIARGHEKSEFTVEDFAQEVWPRKQYWERHSCMLAAQHALVKVQMLGYRLRPPSNAPIEQEDAYAVLDPPHEQRALLALVEHNRWNAERLLLGWKYGKRMNQPPTRPSLTAKSQLPGNELEKDFLQIRAIFEHFRDRGYQFHKID